MDKQEARDRYLKYLKTFEEAQGKNYDQLKEESLSSPEFGDRLNQHVLDMGKRDGIDEIDLTRIISAGPSVDAMVSTVPLSQINQMLANTYANVLKERLDAFTQVSSNVYSTLQRTEQAVFSIAPLPMGDYKSSIQNGSLISTHVFKPIGEAVAWFGNSLQTAEKAVLDQIPFGNTIKKGLQIIAPGAVLAMGVGEHLAVVGPVVSGIHDAVSSASHQLGSMIGGVIENNYLSQHLPSQPELSNGLGSRFINPAKTAIFEAKSYTIHQIASSLGQTASSITQGTSNLVLPAAFASGVRKANQLFSQLSGQSIGESLTQVPALAKEAIAKSQKFIQSFSQTTQENIMPENNAQYIPDNFGIDKLTGITPEKALNELSNRDLAFALEQANALKEQLNSDYTRSKNPGFDYLLTTKGHLEDKAHLSVLTERLKELSKGLPEQSVTSVAKPVVEPVAELNSMPLRVSEYPVAETVVGSVVEPVIGSGKPLEKVEAEIHEDLRSAKPTVELPKSDIEKSYEQQARETIETRLGIRDPRDLANFQINFNGDTLLQFSGGHLKKSDMTKEAHEMLQTALNQADNLKGEVKVMIRGVLAIHVKDGEILQGHNLVQKSNSAEINTPSQVKYKELSADVKAEGLSKAMQVASKMYAASTFEHPVTRDNVIEVLNHNSEFKDIQKRSPETIDRMLQNAEMKSTPHQAGKQRSLEQEHVLA